MRVVYSWQCAVGDQDRLRQVAGIDDHQLRPGGLRQQQRDERERHETAEHGQPPRASCAVVDGGTGVRASYAGNSRSLVRYTLTRWPSRIVIGGESIEKVAHHLRRGF